MSLRTRLIASLDPAYPRFETPEQLADRILAPEPEPNISTLARLMDANCRPLLAAHELTAWRENV